MSRKRWKLSEDAAWEIAVKDHPEWRKAWQRGELPEEIVGEDGEPMNPHLHLQMHAVVERQLATDDPKGAVAIADRKKAGKCNATEPKSRDVCSTLLTSRLPSKKVE